MLLLFLVVDAVNVVGVIILILGPIQPKTILFIDQKLLLLLLLFGVLVDVVVVFGC